MPPFGGRDKPVSSSIPMANPGLPESELFPQAWHSHPRFPAWPSVCGQAPWTGSLLIAVLPLHVAAWPPSQASSPYMCEH